VPTNNLLSIIQKLVKRGYNADPDVVQFIDKSQNPDETINFLITDMGSEVFTFTMADILGNYGSLSNLDSCLQKQISSAFEKPSFEPSISIENDVTGNSTGSGKYTDFVSIFRNRLDRISLILKPRITPSPLNSIKKTSGSVSVVGLVSDIQKTSAGHFLIELEDVSGTFPILINNNSEPFSNADELLLDEVIGIKGTLSNDSEMLFAEKLYFPDVPSNFKPLSADSHVQAALISDIHVGSKNFKSNLWTDFTTWLSTPEAELIEYVLIAGDLVEGVGVYPGQDADLEIINIYEQYRAFNERLKEIPDSISVVMIPGNHDAVRLAEPQPAFNDEIRKILSSQNTHFTSNPSTVTIEGVPILMYHGVSLDEIITELPSEKVSYESPHTAMAQLLKKRHLAPQFGSRTRLAPELRDYLVIGKIPSVFHSGHVHKFSCGKYNNVLLVNSGCWQAQTDFQKRVNIIPDVGYVPILDLDTLNLTIRHFT
tara:strand:+ start:658 stop:2109 length:1452 start_codon:yes stop_codon:yes gene_type:complete